MTTGLEVFLTQPLNLIRAQRTQEKTRAKAADFLVSTVTMTTMMVDREEERQAGHGGW